MSDDPTVPDPIPGEGDPVATGPKGSGEWPSRDAPATGPAPGTVPGASEEIEAGREEATAADPDEVYGEGDERAGVATMPAKERDRLLGRDGGDRDDHRGRDGRQRG